MTDKQIKTICGNVIYTLSKHRLKIDFASVSYEFGITYFRFKNNYLRDYVFSIKVVENEDIKTKYLEIRTQLVYDSKLGVTHFPKYESKVEDDSISRDGLRAFLDYIKTIKKNKYYYLFLSDTLTLYIPSKRDLKRHYKKYHNR